MDISETPECVRIAMNYEIRIDGTVVSENKLLIEAFSAEEKTTMLSSLNQKEIKEDTTAL